MPFVTTETGGEVIIPGPPVPTLECLRYVWAEARPLEESMVPESDLVDWLT